MEGDINELNENREELILFIVLTILGLLAEFNKIEIPYTEAVIDGRWAFGFVGLVLMRRRWAAFLLVSILSIPFATGIPIWVGFLGNLSYAIPSGLVLRAFHRHTLPRWGPDWRYGLGWLVLVLFCYQAFISPVIWAVTALLEGAPVWAMVVQGWQVQVFLVESILVALVSASVIVAVIAYGQLRRSQERLDHINRVLLAIRKVSQVIASETDPHRLIEQACADLTETMGYLNAWVVLLDEERKSVVDVAASGLDDSLDLPRDRLMQGEFPICMKRALERDETIVLDEYRSDCAGCPVAAESGRRAVLCQRLEFSGKLYGVMSVSIPAAYAHDMDEHDLSPR